MRALGSVYGVNRPKGDPLLIGTVKSNIGHLGYAAGVAGLIKAVLSLRHRRLYPSLHMRTPNPLIEFGGAVYVNTELTDWPATDTPRRAGVSSS